MPALFEYLTTPRITANQILDDRGPRLARVTYRAASDREIMQESFVFQQAIEITDPAARDQFLRHIGVDNEQLAERVADLLRAAMEMGDFLLAPVLESTPLGGPSR